MPFLLGFVGGKLKKVPLRPPPPPKMIIGRPLIIYQQENIIEDVLLLLFELSSTVLESVMITHTLQMKKMNFFLFDLLLIA